MLYGAAFDAAVICGLPSPLLSGSHGLFHRRLLRIKVMMVMVMVMMMR